MISITNDCKEKMRSLIIQKKPNETGGILIGTRKNNAYFILYIVDSGPNSIERPYQFKKDFKYAQMELERLWLESNKKWGYLGEWHSHPGGRLFPSITDTKSIGTVTESLTDSGLKPLLLITDVRNEKLQMNLFIADVVFKKTLFKKINIETDSLE